MQKTPLPPPENTPPSSPQRTPPRTPPENDNVKVQEEINYLENKPSKELIEQITTLKSSHSLGEYLRRNNLGSVGEVENRPKSDLERIIAAVQNNEIPAQQKRGRKPKNPFTPQQEAQITRTRSNN